MSTHKELGTKAFTAKDYPKAVEHFGLAIEESPQDHTLYSNRSASYYNMNQFQQALEEAEKCIGVKGDWDKGYQRKAQALHQLGQLDQAIENYEKGLSFNPDNAQIKQGLEQCKREKEQPAGGDDPTGMFGPQAMMKLMSNPRTAAYFQDHKFRNMFEMCKQNPQMLMQLMQTDPRFMDVFKELTGIDLMEMQGEQMKDKEKQEDRRKKEELEAKVRAQEEEIARKQAEEDALPEEEKAKRQAKKEAEAFKVEGNDAYKKKDFELALKKYQEAINLDDTDLTYYTNKAAVFFEQKNYDQCIEECDLAIQKSKEGNYDYVKLGKALSRKANAKLAQGHFEEAIELYKSSLLENNDGNVRDQLKKAERMMKEDVEKKLLDPSKADEFKKRGDDFFKAGDFPNTHKLYL